MADEKEIHPVSPDDSAAQAPRGEDLASEHLEEHPEIPQVNPGASSVRSEMSDESEPIVEDPDALAEATAEAAEAESSDPLAVEADRVADRGSARPQRRVATDVAQSGDAGEQSVATAVAASSLRPKRKSEALAETDEGKRRRRRRDDGDDPKRHTTPWQFVKESGAELRKVVWPTGSQLAQYFVVVLVFVLFIILFVMTLDFGFGWLLLKLFG